MGDVTTHGGKVIRATPFSDTHGKQIARTGDMVSCPSCKRIFPMAQGDMSLIIDGAPAAYHGCEVACGTKLIAGQRVTTTVPSVGAAPNPDSRDEPDSVAQRFGSVADGMAAAYEDESFAEGVRFHGRFQVVSAVDGQPVSCRTVRVRSTDGDDLTGPTDADGYTEWVERDAAESPAFDITE